MPGITGMKCSVLGCWNKKRSRQDLAFHRFPTDLEVCRKWIKISGDEELAFLPARFLTKSRYICSAHFTPESYKPNSILLKRGSVPTIISEDVQPVPDDVVQQYPLREDERLQKTPASTTSGSCAAIAQGVNIVQQYEIQETPASTSSGSRAAIAQDVNIVQQYERQETPASTSSGDCAAIVQNVNVVQQYPLPVACLNVQQYPLPRAYINVLQQYERQETPASTSSGSEKEASDRPTHLLKIYLPYQAATVHLKDKFGNNLIIGCNQHQEQDAET